MYSSNSVVMAMKAPSTMHHEYMLDIKQLNNNMGQKETE